MKKILGVLFVLFALFAFNVPQAFAEAQKTQQQEAEHTLRDVYAYKITGQNYKDVYNAFLNYFGEKAENAKVPEVPYAFLGTRAATGSHYFVKIYPAHKDTNMFIVADEKYDKTTNPITAAFKAMSYNYTELLDQAAIGEYQTDFIGYVRNDYLKNFYVLPDYLKGVKSGVQKATDKAKKNKKKQPAALPYKNEEVQMNLTCIDEVNYNDANGDITINAKEYRLQYKANKVAHAFKYVVYNKGTTDLVLNKVKGSSVANIADLEAQTLVDLDRVDAMSWAAVFPPVLVATCGASMLLKVPAYYRNVRVAKEVTDYAKSFPENYKIPAGSHITFTAIQYKENRKPLHFSFTRNGETFEAAL